MPYFMSTFPSFQVLRSIFELSSLKENNSRIYDPFYNNTTSSQPTFKCRIEKIQEKDLMLGLDLNR
jgi:hypothetical protein